jgi:hypothetical protein
MATPDIDRKMERYTERVNHTRPSVSNEIDLRMGGTIHNLFS